MIHHCPEGSLVLIVEDNSLIAEFVETHLCQAGFAVVSVPTYADALHILQHQHPDLMVLDIVLDDGLGFDLCRAVRSGGEQGELSSVAEIPILILSARSSEEDRIAGFHAGADDYVIKPFNPDELVCRIRSIIRRSSGVSAARIDIGPLVLDPRRHEVQINNESIELTPKEFELLHLLASHPGSVYSREELFERVWRSSFLGQSRTVDVHVNRLRQKLESKGSCGDLIVTEWGMGYKMALLENEVGV